jgi:hypothetical protein
MQFKPRPSKVLASWPSALRTFLVRRRGLCYHMHAHCKLGLDLNANLTAHVGKVEEAKETGVTREMQPGMPTAVAMSI